MTKEVEELSRRLAAAVVRYEDEPAPVEDPANPTGNDLSQLLKSAWPELSARARDTLNLLERSGWEAIFGPIEGKETEESKTRSFIGAAAAVVTPTKPWCPKK